MLVPEGLHDFQLFALLPRQQLIVAVLIKVEHIKLLKIVTLIKISQ